MPTTRRIPTITEVAPADYTAARFVEDLLSIVDEADDSHMRMSAGRSMPICEWLTRRGHSFYVVWDGRPLPGRDLLLWAGYTGAVASLDRLW